MSAALLRQVLTKRAQAAFTNVGVGTPRAPRLPGKWNEQIKLPTQGEWNTQRMLMGMNTPATPATTAATAPAVPPAPAALTTASAPPAPASTYQF